MFIVGLSACGIDSMGRRNTRNVAKLSLGMTLNEVYEIMGKPDTIRKYEQIDQGVFRLIYDPPFGNSDNIYVIIDEKDSLVRAVQDGSE